MGAPMSTTKPVANPEDAFLSPGDGVAISFWIISLAAGLAGWGFIIHEIFNGESGGNANGCSEAVATAFNNMRQIVTVGWSIYPLGYFFGYLLNSVDETFLNVIYNIADFVNKIAFVLSCCLVPKLILRRREPCWDKASSQIAASFEELTRHAPKFSWHDSGESLALVPHHSESY